MRAIPAVPRARVIAAIAVAIACVAPATAQALDVTAVPATVDFGTVSTGATTPAQTVTFTNPYGAVGFLLDAPAVLIAGANRDDYAVSSTTCATILNALASCTADLAFTPRQAGARNAVARLVGPGGDVWGEAALTGTLTVPPSVITATAPTFATTAPGSTAAGIVTLRNAQSYAVALGTASLSAGGALSIAYVDTCSGATLGPGATCGIQLDFAPTRSGTTTGTLTVPGTGLAAAITVQLEATAAVPPPAVLLVSGSVGICHAGGAGKNLHPISVDYHSIVTGRGHGQHAADIIPPFRYGNGSLYPGRNWTAAGQATYRRLNCGGAPGSFVSQTAVPQPPRQASVELCHASGPSSWQRLVVSADQAYAVHALRDRADVIPPFTIATTAGSLAFLGKNWDGAGEALLRNGCVRPAPTEPAEPARSVAVCIASGGVYARLAVTPATALRYATAFPGSIIPPFDFAAGTGMKSFAGRNWTDAADRAIFDNGCIDPRPAVQPVTPSVECVQVGADGSFTAYFDVTSPNADTIALPAGTDNAVTATGVASSPPAAFAPGTTPRALTVAGIASGGSVTWSITLAGQTKSAVATAASSPCAQTAATIGDLGLFVSCVDRTGSTYTAVFGYVNQASSPLAVAVGSANAVQLSAPEGAPANQGQPTVFEPGPHPDAFRVTGVPVAAVAAWTVKIGGITRWVVADGTREPACRDTAPTPVVAPAITPPTGPYAPVVGDLQPVGVFVSCVRSNRDGSMAVVFGYDNPNPVAVHVPAGPLNAVASGSQAGDDQGQTVDFLPGYVADAWTIPAASSTQPVTWTISTGSTSEATAGANSPACATGRPTVPPKPVEPDPVDQTQTIGVFATCTRVTGKTYTATFGYEVSGGPSISVPVGGANRFTASPANRGQVTEFSAGRHEAAFSVSGIPLRRSLTWTVKSPDGTVASAVTSASGPDCVTSVPPTVPSIDVAVPLLSGSAVTGVVQPQPVVITNTGTTTATDVVVVVPSNGSQVVTVHRGSASTSCSVAADGTVRVPMLAPGARVRCTVGVKALTCEPSALLVSAAGTGRSATGRVSPYSGGSGGRSSCRIGSSGVVG